MHTYFIQREDGGPIKIGKSANLRARLSSLQGGSITPLVCVAFLDFDCEAELHHRFHHLCVGGEWFRDDPSLLDFIRRHATTARICLPPPHPDVTAQKRRERVAFLASLPPQCQPRWKRERLLED